ncbi:MAG: ABC transporter ATP-binding protein, partial [Minisyncoccia bacterium]
MIKFKNVWKIYKLDGEVEYQALKNVSLQIKESEFVSIIGPSGSGKSTLMHLLGLLDKPTKGDIFINGKNIVDLNDDQLSTLRNEFVGFVFQQFNLIPKLTILENILLPTIYARKKLNYDSKEKALTLIKKFGLAGKEFSF